MQDGPVIDLSRLAERNHRFDLTVNTESPEDAEAHRDNASAEALLARRMRAGLFLFAMACVATVFGGRVYLFATGTADDKKWAGGILASITSGLVGYLIGSTKRTP